MCVTTKEQKSSAGAISHQGCLLCGGANPFSLQLSFQETAEGGVRTDFLTSSVLQGYPGILHGGVTASLLDAAMTNCLFQHGIQAYTADLHVRYLHPVPCPAQLEIKAWIVSEYAPLYQLRSEISREQQIMARGEGKFVRCQGV
ncbi:MAG: PaaI family thioesterase [Oligosphaeraceae bacterium]|nr:PaaI family thioesterase [Oligosphaeraceae bacterium]